MQPQFRNRKGEVTGFPFPYTPPTSKHESLASPAFSSIPSILPNDCPFLTNVGELNGTFIVRGGFGAKKDPYGHISSRFVSFPPPPNAAYGLTSQAYVPKDATNIEFKVYTPNSSEDDAEDDASGQYVTGVELSGYTNTIRSSGVKNFDGTAHDKDELNATTKEKDPRSINEMVYIPPRRQPLTLSIRCTAQEQDKTATTSIPGNTKTRGELLADTINFNRPSWVMTTPGVSGVLYPAEDQRADFIAHIDKDISELEYCRKCKTKHIPPGAPITLEDRDTCGSYLPEWFPADAYEKPWRTFNKLMNDMLYLDELSQGYNHKPNPDEPVWDLQFHEYSSKWRELGRRGGWWKCRDGKGATDVERDCHVCHNERVEAARVTEATNRGRSVADCLASLHDFIDYHVKEGGERDKATVLAQIRAEGYPQYLGPRTVEEERFRNPVVSRTASMSTIYTHYSMETTTSSVGYGSPVRGRSPVRRQWE